MDLANQGHKLDDLDEDNEPDDDDEDEEQSDGETISFEQFKKNPSFETYLQLGKGMILLQNFLVCLSFKILE